MRGTLRAHRRAIDSTQSAYSTTEQYIKMLSNFNAEKEKERDRRRERVGASEIELHEHVHRRIEHPFNKQCLSVRVVAL